MDAACGQLSGVETRRRVDENDWRPRNCVWELTLACNLRCGHCGSRAGKARPAELGTKRCLGIAGELADLGCELVTLSGGEPTLRSDWDVVARAIADRGIKVNMVTNGVYRDLAAAREVADRAVAAGLCNVGVSIDGPEDLHDWLRGRGTFARTLAAVEAFRAAGLSVGVLTTVNRRNLRRLPEVRRIAMDAGASLWRLQLAKPMGTLGERRDLVIAPEHLLVLVPMLARLKKAGGIHLAVGDSIGYYGPHDDVLRGRGWRGRRECWKGCQAGMQAVGIEADGGVKGCLSLQAKWGERDPFVEGSLRERSLDSIWFDPRSFGYNRDFREEALTGTCAGCPKGDVCRGGARCVSSATLGLVTEDPYCWYRVARADRAAVPTTLARAAAAVALAVSLGSAACGSSSGKGDDDAGSVGADYGFEPPQDAGGGGEDGGSSADAGDDAGTADAGQDASVGADYGVDPCEGVCCDCDYGEPPPPECCPP